MYEWRICPKFNIHAGEPEGHPQFFLKCIMSHWSITEEQDKILTTVIGPPSHRVVSDLDGLQQE